MSAASDTASLGASQASTGKAKARELGEKTFSDFKQRRLSFRQAHQTLFTYHPISELHLPNANTLATDMADPMHAALELLIAEKTLSAGGRASSQHQNWGSVRLPSP